MFFSYDDDADTEPLIHLSGSERKPFLKPSLSSFPLPSFINAGEGQPKNIY